MPRIQRKKSKTGYYHVIIRGNEKRNIFNDDEDRYRFIDTLYQKKKEDAFHLHAFCLMDNHVHLAISEGRENISSVMKRITVSYVHHFNKKYKRTGHLFQDRFRSETVENDSYLLTLARYIHQNPVKAKVVRSPEEYKWSSYNTYIRGKDYFHKIIDKEFLLSIFSDDAQEAQKHFIEFMNMKSEKNFLDIPQDDVMDEDEARTLLKRLLEDRSAGSNNPIPHDLIIEFKSLTGLSIRRIADIIGLNKNKVSRMLKKVIHE